MKPLIDQCEQCQPPRRPTKAQREARTYPLKNLCCCVALLHQWNDTRGPNGERVSREHLRASLLRVVERDQGADHAREARRLYVASFDKETKA